MTTQSGYTYSKDITVEEIRESRPKGTYWLGTPRARACGFAGSAYKVECDNGTSWFTSLTEARRFARSCCNQNTRAPWAEIFRAYESGVRAGFALVATYERELIVK